jgi:uncharacterized protein (DUF433 family)
MSEPRFKGTRVPVKNLLDYLEGGYNIEVFLIISSGKREQVIKFWKLPPRISHEPLS